MVLPLPHVIGAIFLTHTVEQQVEVQKTRGSDGTFHDNAFTHCLYSQ